MAAFYGFEGTGDRAVLRVCVARQLHDLFYQANEVYAQRVSKGKPPGELPRVVRMGRENELTIEN